LNFLRLCRLVAAAPSSLFGIETVRRDRFGCTRNLRNLYITSHAYGFDLILVRLCMSVVVVVATVVVAAVVLVILTDCRPRQR
jgi:Flp pilus assembly protein TadB